MKKTEQMDWTLKSLVSLNSSGSKQCEVERMSLDRLRDWVALMAQQLTHCVKQADHSLPLSPRLRKWRGGLEDP